MDGSGPGTTTGEEEDDRSEVATPELSLIDTAENPLERWGKDAEWEEKKYLTTIQESPGQPEEAAGAGGEGWGRFGGRAHGEISVHSPSFLKEVNKRIKMAFTNFLKLKNAIIWLDIVPNG